MRSQGSCDRMVLRVIVQQVFAQTEPVQNRKQRFQSRSLVIHKGYPLIGGSFRKVIIRESQFGIRDNLKIHSSGRI